LDDDEFDPLVFLIGASGLALGGLAGTGYFWRLATHLKQQHASERAELKKHRDAANRADNELQRSKSEADALRIKLEDVMLQPKNETEDMETLRKKLKEWKREAEILCKERDESMAETRKLHEKSKAAAEERDRYKEGRDFYKAEAEAASKSGSARHKPLKQEIGEGQSLEMLFKEIDATMKKLRQSPTASRASELRTLKRSYHPDAQRVKSEAVQNLFTQLSAYVNGFCEAHLRRDCPSCNSTRGAI
jgi:chromosome segregation ATPase